eukprot:gene13663-19551_t
MPTGGWALVTFLIAFIINLSQWLITRNQLQSKASLKAQLIADIAELRKEATRLNAPATFASCAKCQRQANAKEKQLNALEASTGSASEQLHNKIQKVLSWMKTAGAVMGTFAAFGLVAGLPWWMMCNRASNMIIQAALPALKSTPKSRPAAAKAVESAPISQADKKDL